MLGVVEKLRLSGLYQLLALPATSATKERAERRPPIRAEIVSIPTSKQGITARPAYTPFGGSARE
jgi:hypothetical protein